MGKSVFLSFLFYINVIFCSLREIESRVNENTSEEFSHFVVEENDLEVIIIMNPLSSGSSLVSLNLNLPPLAEETPGLYHLFEHVIVEWGKKKDEESFSNFITSRSGIYNGFTQRQGVTFRFCIGSPLLEEALGRFADLFLSRNFCSEKEEFNPLNEIEAIDKEFREILEEEDSIGNYLTWIDFIRIRLFQISF